MAPQPWCGDLAKHLAVPGIAEDLQIFEARICDRHLTRTKAAPELRSSRSFAKQVHLPRAGGYHWGRLMTLI